MFKIEPTPSPAKKNKERKKNQKQKQRRRRNNKKRTFIEFFIFNMIYLATASFFASFADFSFFASCFTFISRASFPAINQKELVNDLACANFYYSTKIILCLHIFFKKSLVSKGKQCLLVFILTFVLYMFVAFFYWKKQNKTNKVLNCSATNYH